MSSTMVLPQNIQQANSRAIMLNNQSKFLQAGGGYELGLTKLRAAGIIPEVGSYVFQPYPKMIRLPVGEPHDVERSTEIGAGHSFRTWIDHNVQDYEEIIVNSEEEEERVLSGGKTTTQLEEERQGLLTRARGMGIPAGPNWTAVRLRRELGDALDAPSPGDKMAQVEAELEGLRRMAAMQDEIAMLKAKLAAGPDAPAAETAEEPARGKRAKE